MALKTFEYMTVAKWGLGALLVVGAFYAGYAAQEKIAVHDVQPQAHFEQQQAHDEKELAHEQMRQKEREFINKKFEAQSKQSEAQTTALLKAISEIGID